MIWTSEQRESETNGMPPIQQDSAVFLLAFLTVSFGLSASFVAVIVNWVVLFFLRCTLESMEQVVFCIE